MQYMFILHGLSIRIPIPITTVPIFGMDICTLIEIRVQVRQCKYASTLGDLTFYDHASPWPHFRVSRIIKSRVILRILIPLVI